MSATPKSYDPKVFSDEEIEMFLSADRKEIDRLILYNLNRIAAVLIPHAEREEDLTRKLEMIGGFDTIRERAEFVDSLIKRNNTRAAMMRKVSESAVTWALFAFLAFLASAVWNDVLAAIRTALKLKGG